MPFYMGRKVPEEEEVTGKAIIIRFSGKWFPASFWKFLFDLINEYGENRLVAINTFNSKSGVKLTEVFLKGDLSPRDIEELEERIVKAMNEMGVDPRRFINIEKGEIKEVKKEL